MKPIKAAILICSAAGVWHIIKKQRKKIANRKSEEERGIKLYSEVRTAEITIPDKFMHMTREQAQDEFKNKIEAGEWLTENEYDGYMHAIKKNSPVQPTEEKITDPRELETYW